MKIDDIHILDQSNCSIMLRYIGIERTKDNIIECYKFTKGYFSKTTLEKLEEHFNNIKREKQINEYFQEMLED